MLYDKNHFKKINDKKVLHKVRKHWVVLSLATLMLLGGGSVVSNTTAHASQNGNHSSNNGSNNSSLKNIQGDNHSPQLVNGNQFANQPTQSKDTVNSSNQNASKSGDGLNALNLSKAKPQANYHTSNLLNSHSRLANQMGQGRTKQSQPSVTLQQIQSATKKAEKRNRLYKAAAEHWHNLGRTARLGSMRQIRRQLGGSRNLGEMLGADYEHADDAYNDINNKVASMATFETEYSGYQSSMSSASNSANAEWNRYANVDSLVDSSEEASVSRSQINSDISAMPNDSMAIDSITASLAGSEATSFSNVTTTNMDQINSLATKVDTLYSTMSNAMTSAANSNADVINQAVSVSNDFSSVSAEANSVGATRSNAYNDDYPVANVYNGDDLYEAAWNSHVHQINIMSNMNLWDMPAEHGGAIDQYQDVPGRNLTVNGLTNDGHWYTVDGINYNFEMDNENYADPGHPNELHELIKNLRMYSNSFYGMFSINENTDNDKTTQEYYNIDYVGSELTYNQSSKTNSIFGGKVRINLGAYAPEGQTFDGTPITKYDYDSGGLSPVPYTGEKEQIENDSTARNYFHTLNAVEYSLNKDGIVYPNTNDGNNQNHGIDQATDQQILQLDGVNVEFLPGCDFNGYTSNSDGIDSRYGGNIILDNNAKVHITPRGNYGENFAISHSLPVGIYIDGSGRLDVGNGATLKITPTDQTDPYNPAGGNYNNYYPGAIYIDNSGTMLLHPGSTVDIAYPKHDYHGNGTRSLPDSQCHALNGYDPNGALTIGGNASITAERDSNLIVNGGNPSNKANQRDGQDSVGNLVAFDGGDAGSAVRAEPGSSVDLSAGGAGPDDNGGPQPINLFHAPNGTQVTVDDPKLFKLNFLDNHNPESQLASSGVGIDGQHVEVHDQHGRSFGQYKYSTFPGGISNLVSTDPDLSGLKSQLDGLWGNGNGPLLQAIGGDSNISAAKSTVAGAESAVYNTVEQIYPYAVDPLTNAHSEALSHDFNHSIDIPRTVLSILSGQIKSALGHGLTDSEISTILHDPKVRDYNYQQDEPMTYDGQTLYIHPTGFNLQQGFAFTGVPDTYVEGIKVNGNTVSGYAYPKSFIRFNRIAPNGGDGPAITTPGVQPIDDHLPHDGQEAYDPGDNSQFHTDYVTQASDMGNGLGYWSYTLPSNVNPNDVRVTAHTQTVSPADAARRVTNYTSGRNNVDRNDSPDKANTYDSVITPGAAPSDPNYYANIPTVVYNDDQRSGDYDETNGNIIGDRGSQQTDDSNAGQDFQAGLFKGTHDKTDLITDKSIDQYPRPFILGYELAQKEDMSSTGEQSLAEDKIMIDNTSTAYNDYLHQIEVDSNSASSNDTTLSNTSSAVSSDITSLSQASAGYAGNLNSTSSSVYSASSSAQSSDSNITSQYNSVSGIDTWASSISNEFTSLSNNFSDEKRSYKRYYGKATKAYSDGDNNAKEVNLIQANAVASAMSNDVSSANSLASQIETSDSTASNDNQSASSDSNSISGSALSVETSASNFVASAFSSSANSYSSSVNSASSAASLVNGSIGNKTNALSSTGSMIASEYSIVKSLESKYPSLTGVINPYNISGASIVASNNNVTATSDSSIAQGSNDQLYLYSGSAYAMSQSVSNYTTSESSDNRHSNFSSASFDNNEAGIVISNMNSNATSASSTVSSEWTIVRSLNDSSASVSMSDALSAAESMAQSYATEIDVDSGIAKAESSATSDISTVDSSAISMDSAASTAIASDSASIASDSSAIMSDFSGGNISDADSRASKIESFESNAESIAESAKAEDVSRTLPILFETSNGSALSCNGKATATGMIGSTVSLSNEGISVPSGYYIDTSYAYNEPNNEYNPNTNQYTFAQSNINKNNDGQMNPQIIHVIGDSASVKIDYIDANNDSVVGSYNFSKPNGSSLDVGDSVGLPSNTSDAQSSGLSSSYSLDSNYRWGNAGYQYTVKPGDVAHGAVIRIPVVGSTQQEISKGLKINVVYQDGTGRTIGSSQNVPVTTVTQNGNNTAYFVPANLATPEGYKLTTPTQTSYQVTVNSDGSGSWTNHQEPTVYFKNINNHINPMIRVTIYKIVQSTDGMVLGTYKQGLVPSARNVGDTYEVDPNSPIIQTPDPDGRYPGIHLTSPINPVFGQVLSHNVNDDNYNEIYLSKPVINFYYTVPNANSNVNVHYIDQDKHDIGDHNFNGVDGSTVASSDITNDVPQGYTMTSNAPTVTVGPTDKDIDISVTGNPETMEVEYDYDGQKVNDDHSNSTTGDGDYDETVKVGDDVQLPTAADQIPTGYMVAGGQPMNHNVTVADDPSHSGSFLVKVNLAAYNKTLPIKYVDQNDHQVGSQDVDGKFGDVIPLNVSSNLSNYYDIDSNQNNNDNTDLTDPTKYTFEPANVDGSNKSYMNTDTVHLVGKNENVPITFIDQAGHQVQTTNQTAQMGNQITLPDAPSGYQYDNGQSNQYTLTPGNVNTPGTMNTVYVNVDGQQVAPSQTNGNRVQITRIYEDSTGHQINSDVQYNYVDGPVGTDYDVSPETYLPDGYQLDTSNNRDQSVNGYINQQGDVTIPNVTFYYLATSQANTDVQPITVAYIDDNQLVKEVTTNDANKYVGEVIPDVTTDSADNLQMPNDDYSPSDQYQLDPAHGSQNVRAVYSNSPQTMIIYIKRQSPVNYVFTVNAEEKDHDGNIIKTVSTPVQINNQHDGEVFNYSPNQFIPNSGHGYTVDPQDHEVTTQIGADGLTQKNVTWVYDVIDHGQQGAVDQPINVTYHDVDNNSDIINNSQVNGNLGSYVDVTNPQDGGISVPSGYALDPNQQTVYQIGTNPQNVTLNVHGVTSGSNLLTLNLVSETPSGDRTVEKQVAENGHTGSSFTVDPSPYIPSGYSLDASQSSDHGFNDQVTPSGLSIKNWTFYFTPDESYNGAGYIRTRYIDDRNGSQVGFNDVSGKMDQPFTVAELGTNGLPNGYTVDPNQDQTYTISTNNVEADIMVHANEANNQDDDDVATISIQKEDPYGDPIGAVTQVKKQITGHYGDTYDIKPSDYTPTGYVPASSDQDLTGKIQPNGSINNKIAMFTYVSTATENVKPIHVLYKESGQNAGGIVANDTINPSAADKDYDGKTVNVVNDSQSPVPTGYAVDPGQDTNASFDTDDTTIAVNVHPTTASKVTDNFQIIENFYDSDPHDPAQTKLVNESENGYVGDQYHVQGIDTPAGFTAMPGNPVKDANGNVVNGYITSNGLSQPNVVYNFQATESSRSTDGQSNHAQPILVTFADGNQTIGTPNQPVDGYMGQSVNVLDQNAPSHVSLPANYQLASGANTTFTIGDQPNDHQTIQVTPNKANNAMVLYLDQNDHMVAQRQINAPVGTLLSSLQDQYDSYMPYGYRYVNHNWTDSTTVANDGHYVVNVAKNNVMPQPNPYVAPQTGWVDVEYQDNTGKTLATRQISGKATDSFDVDPYEQTVSDGGQMPDNFSNPSVVQSVNNFVAGQNQTEKIQVTPSADQQATAYIQYVDAFNNQPVGNKIQINGLAGQDIDYSPYTQFIPQNYGYDGMGNYDSVLENNETNVILVRPTHPMARKSQIKVDYVDPNGQSVASVIADGYGGQSFNAGYYDDHMPKGYVYAGQTSDVRRFSSNGQMLVNKISVKPAPAAAKHYGMITIHYQDAQGNPIQVEGKDKMTAYGLIGSFFDPSAYENNIPQGYVFDNVKVGGDVRSFKVTQNNNNNQDIYIVVDRISNN